MPIWYGPKLGGGPLAFCISLREQWNLTASNPTRALGLVSGVGRAPKQSPCIGGAVSWKTMESCDSLQSYDLKKCWEAFCTRQLKTPPSRVLYEQRRDLLLTITLGLDSSDVFCFFLGKFEPTKRLDLVQLQKPTEMQMSCGCVYTDRFLEKLRSSLIWDSIYLYHYIVRSINGILSIEIC